MNRHLARRIAALAAATALALPGIAGAEIVFTNLGTTSPPASVGGHPLTPFAQAPQLAIPDYASVAVIPGNPFPGQLAVSPAATKYKLGDTWGTHPWPGGFLGAAFFSGQTQASQTLTLPPDTRAFYFYLQNNADGAPADTVTVTTDDGTSTGPVQIETLFWEPNVGAVGFAFHSTNGESIASITIQTDNSNGFGIGNLGISVAATTTCASEGYTGTKLTWCQNICEKGYTGSTLAMWIRRWTDRYRDLPYCAANPTPPPV